MKIRLRIRRGVDGQAPKYYHMGMEEGPGGSFIDNEAEDKAEEWAASSQAPKYSTTTHV